MTDFFDSFDFEPNDRYYIIKDQFGKDCWYDPNKETMVPIDVCYEEQFIPLVKKLKLDDEPSLN